jgi:predicted nucleotidyltransferase
MKERWRVVKAVKPSGNSGSVYVPREWIGQSVEISLYSAEAIVLEALYPYVGSILGVYLYGPHAAGGASPEEDIDVLVISDKDLDIEDIEGVNCTVIIHDKLEEYAGAYPAEFAAILSEALPLMNERLLREMRAYKLVDKTGEVFYDSLERSIAIARSLAREGDYSSAAYALMQKLLDYSVLSAGGNYSYGAFEGYTAGKGIAKERFAGLFEACEAKKHDKEPRYMAAPEDVAALLKILEEISGKKDEVDVETYPEDHSGSVVKEGTPEKEVKDAPVEGLSRENLMEKARKYKERYGGGAI